MRIYTRTGDQGLTSLIGGERVPKFDSRVEAYGSVDELSAQTAMMRDMLTREGEACAEAAMRLADVLTQLMSVAALLAVGRGGEGKVAPLGDEPAGRLEAWMDEMDARLSPITKFTIPGGHPVVSQAHICRTVCRRAERAALRAAESHPVDRGALVYLNRLSDYFYLLGRLLGQQKEIEENLWIP